MGFNSAFKWLNKRVGGSKIQCGPFREEKRVIDSTAKLKHDLSVNRPARSLVTALTEISPVYTTSILQTSGARRNVHSRLTIELLPVHSEF
jgi:hypothetical protein